jgi:hypothetical protein
MTLPSMRCPGGNSHSLAAPTAPAPFRASQDRICPNFSGSGLSRKYSRDRIFPSRTNWQNETAGSPQETSSAQELR